MVRLLIDFRSEGISFAWDAGVFARKDAAGVAAMIRRETEAAALDGDDVEFIGHRTEELAPCL